LGIVMVSDLNTPPPANQANGSNGDSVRTTNPYETAAELIPKDDPFLQQNPQYGRYAPHDADFKPRHHRWWQADADAFAYWEGVVKSSCTPENSLNVSGPREAYATGSIIIRVDHDGDMSDVGDKYSYVNANELSAARKAEEPLKELGIAVPLIYFCGTIDGKNVTVESRIPGVSLEVAWRYLTADQIASFKEQCRRVLKCLAGIDPAPDQPSYVCSGLNPQSPPGVETAERDILFAEKDDENLCLVHNNMTVSNIIVDDDKLVGISGWRHSGYFGFERANKIHRQFRTQASTFANGASEGMQCWADLYEGLPKADGDQSISAKDAIAPQVKTEPASMNLDKVPLTEETESKSFAQLDGTEDHPTQKNIANLKHGGASRASSSDRSSPAPSTKLGSMGRKSTPGGTKKAPAKRAAPKKRKINDEDNDSVDGGRSNTPSSLRASKAPSAKKQGSASIASSPAPESKKKVGKKGNKKASTKEESEEDDDNEVFCICRKPDNHTWMIGCDGECEDWFHGKCVNIDPRDADLIEKYICKIIFFGVVLNPFS
jgi:COMPASS component SPP1